jgi:protein TonB
MVNIMIVKSVIFLVASFLAACAPQATRDSARSDTGSKGANASTNVETTRDGTSTASTLHNYKEDVAQRITHVNPTKVYTGRPQALLRSVIVVKYQVDGNGNLVRSEIMRTNRDRVNEATAMSSLKNTAPFPKPAPHLLRQGRVEIMESWLFNNDGRFQLRTIALPQMDQ